MSGVELLALAATAGTSLCGGIFAIRVVDSRRRDGQRDVVRLHFPQDVKADNVLAFVRSLSGLHANGAPFGGHRSTVFEVVATGGVIEHQVRMPRERTAFISAQLRSAIPGIGIEKMEEIIEPVTVATELRLSSADHMVRTDQPETTAAALLSAMCGTGKDEMVCMQWIVVPNTSSAASPQRAKRTSGAMATLFGFKSSAGRGLATSKAQRDKLNEPVFATACRVGAKATDRRRAYSLANGLAMMLRVVERPGMRFLRRAMPMRVVAKRLNRATTPVVEFGCHLNARELATLVAWPVGSPHVRGLEIGRSKRLEPAPDVPRFGRVLGDSDVPGTDRPVAISPADSTYHGWIIGPTGSGKSTLLANLITQDIEADRAVVVVDPKGDLVRDLADRVPERRIDDVIWLDPTDEERPVGLNLLHGSERDPELVTDAVVSMFRHLYAAYFGPRTSDILTSALLTLTRRPGMTLVELPSLLTDEGFRRSVLGGLDDPILLGFWAGYEALGVGGQANAIGSVMNKLRAFVLDRRLRNVLGQAEPTWSLAEVLNERKILLVNLAKGQLGSGAAAQIGSLVVAMLWGATQRRTVRTPAMVVLDEFQDVINTPTDLGDVLAQARGFGVSLTMAHQHLGQLTPALRSAVAANARTKVSFQSGVDDATIIAKQLGGGLLPTDLTGLPAHHAYVSACVNAAVRPPMSIATRPMPPSLGSAETVRAASRLRYGRDRVDVEAAILERTNGNSQPDALPGRRRRSS